MPRLPLVWVISSLWVFGIAPAQAAATPETGTELLAACEAADSGASSPRAVGCTAYLIGIFDALRAFSGNSRDPLICPPPGIKDEQFAKAFQKWARSNPHRLAAYPAAGALEAVIEAFSCTKEKPPQPAPRPRR